MIASHVLAQVALRRELNVVYEELFAAGGAEICFRRVSDYGIAGQNVSFGQIEEMSACRGEIALGVRLQNDGIVLNPAHDEHIRQVNRMILLYWFRGIRHENLGRVTLGI